MKTLKKFDIIIVFIIAATYNSIYSLAFMKGLYYSIVQHGLDITHAELGHLYSSYGLCAMFSYLCGAFFLNRYKVWKLICVSSFIIGVLTLLLLITPSFYVMLIIFGVIGFLLGSLFYPSHLQVLHQIGGTLNQGKVFSLFYISNGILGIVFAVIGFGITSISQPDTQLVRYLFIFFASLNIVIALFATVFLRKLPDANAGKATISLKSVTKLTQNKKLWCVIIIVFANYVTFSSLNYMLPFLNQTFDLSPMITNILSILRVYMLAIIAAPIAGKITDHLRSASKLLEFSFIATTIIVLSMILLFKNSTLGTVICLLTLCISVHMGKSMALVTIDDARIPHELYGMSISFISFCAYSPDAFFYSIGGFLIDTFPSYGYTFIFSITVIVSIIGCIACHKIRK